MEIEFTFKTRTTAPSETGEFKTKDKHPLRAPSPAFRPPQRPIPGHQARPCVGDAATHGPAAGQHTALRAVGCAGRRSSRPPGANTRGRASGLALPVREMGVTPPGRLGRLMNESRRGKDSGGARQPPAAVPWPRDVPRRGQSRHGQTPPHPPNPEPGALPALRTPSRPDGYRGAQNGARGDAGSQRRPLR